jgi:hypothetical protein
MVCPFDLTVEGQFPMSNTDQRPSRETRPIQTTAAEANKIERPHAHFRQPGEVVVDLSLSKHQKENALETMEQDARQLAVASAEGMTGGEDTKLHEVLEAKAALELPPADVAYSVVLQSLRSKLPNAAGPDAHEVVARAITALEAALAVITPQPVNPAPGSDAELEVEIQMEKLDP